ncbi:MAG TPA: IS630 family transposase [Syntrophorhabdales bacterium]|nr:IS630 family transposase [Syntrophorhabdales bacterium]
MPNPENASLADLYATQRAGRNGETYRRITVIILLLTGSSREQVMRGFDLSESAVRKIVKAFNAYSIDGLIAKKRSGRRRIISKEQKEELIEEFEEPGRAQRTFWTATAFYGHIKEKYRIECSYDTVLRLLHEKGYVLKVPQPWPDRQDEAEREAFRLKLAPFAADPDVELWYGDETGIEGEPKPRRGWAVRGSRPRVAHNGDHTRLTILGCVCPRTGDFFAIEASHCDTDVFQAFLDEAATSIIPTKKRNILILDNASWHKRKSLNWHFFEPLYLPPYSPDFNPIERIWLIMKADHFTNTHFRTKAALIERADRALCELMDNPEKVASGATPIGN